MNVGLAVSDVNPAIAITVVTKASLAHWCEQQQNERVNTWIQTIGFAGKEQTSCLISSTTGMLEHVLVGANENQPLTSLAGLAKSLPAGRYYLELAVGIQWTATEEHLALLGFLLDAYSFDRYKTLDKTPAKTPDTIWLLHEDANKVQAVQREAAAIALVRDLINTPAEDMMPQHLAEASIALADEFGGQVNQVIGDDLLAQNYPMIHAVGRASEHLPRLIKLTWGDVNHPHLVLVGKGVCFDTGGLDLKPASNMRLMKKDMGGAAHVLGLARLIMATALPVQLTVLIAAVDNAVSGNSYRPGDVFTTRKGLTVEVDNTDAEGRLVLSDALAYAAEMQPSLVVDYATLTGAARVAVGPDIAAMFTPDDQIANALAAMATAVADPLWRLPLHKPYKSMLKSQVADLINSPCSPFAGATAAALFLAEFIGEEVPWVHYDVMAYNSVARPTAPIGGEALALRATYHFLAERYRS